jgi:hypothetical protein
MGFWMLLVRGKERRETYIRVRRFPFVGECSVVYTDGIDVCKIACCQARAVNTKRVVGRDGTYVWKDRMRAVRK